MNYYSDKFLRELLSTTKTIAMIGVSLNEMRPSYFVARYLNLKGYRIVPINPGQAGKTLFGQMIYPSLSEIPEEVGPFSVSQFRLRKMAKLRSSWYSATAVKTMLHSTSSTN